MLDLWYKENKISKNYSKDKIIVMNMCGRGDKDIFTVAQELKIKL
jgi:tryptophan synthase beta chain